MRTHVVVAGEGPAVVCTHGIGADHHTFDAVAALLAPDHRVVTWDLPGHGRSPLVDDPLEYGRDRVLEDLDEIVAGIGGAPVLVGHSLGGYLTLAWAATRPERASGLCILATGPGFRDPAKRDKWNAMSRRNAHRFGVAEQVTEMNLQHDALVIDKLASIDVPVELVVGSADSGQLVAGMEYLEAKLASSRLTIVEGGDHTLHEAGRGAATVAEAVRRLTRPVRLPSA